MATFIERTDDGFLVQVNTFNSKIGTYATLLGVTAGETTSLQADLAMLSWAVTSQNIIRTFAHNFTNFKDLLRYGHGTDQLNQLPAMPALDTPPALVAANVQKRFSDLVKRIKGSPNYTKAIGEDLGIEAAQEVFDPQAGKPIFKITYSSGGHPHLIWKKGKFQGVEIWVDRGDGNWAKLERDFHPDFTDKSPLPTAGSTAVWKYKMIYLYQDEIVGSYSAEQQITVYGAV